MYGVNPGTGRHVPASPGGRAGELGSESATVVRQPTLPHSMRSIGEESAVRLH